MNLGLGLGLATRLKGGVAVFVPPTSGLRADFNPASGITLVSGKVSTWANAFPAGGTADLGQPNASQRPTLVAAGLAGKDYVSFDGVDDILFMSSGTEVHPSTLYLVCRQPTWVSNHYLCDGRNVLSMALAQNGTTPEIDQHAGAAFGNANTGLTVNTWKVVTSIIAPPSGSGLRVDKAAIVSGGSVGSNDPGGLCLACAGNMVDLSNCANVDIARVLFYAGAHSTPTQNTIIDGLKAYYGV